MSIRKKYTDLRRRYRVIVRDPLNNAEERQDIVTQLRALTGKWDFGAGGPEPRNRRNQKWVSTSFRGVRLTDLSPDARPYGKWVGTELAKRVVAIRVLHTTNSMRWTLRRWDLLDKADRLARLTGLIIIDEMHTDTPVPPEKFQQLAERMRQHPSGVTLSSRYDPK
jgi:hypothetical protein